MNNTAELLTDTDILGDLPAQIKAAPYIRQPEAADRYAAMLRELEQARAVPASKPVQVYVRQAQPRRVPRARWGWIVEPRKYRKSCGHGWLTRTTVPA